MGDRELGKQAGRRLGRLKSLGWIVVQCWYMCLTRSFVLVLSPVLRVVGMMGPMCRDTRSAQRRVPPKLSMLWDPTLNCSNQLAEYPPPPPQALKHSLGEKGSACGFSSSLPVALPIPMVPLWNLLFCSWSLSALLCLLVPPHPAFPPPTNLIFLKTPKQSYEQVEHLKAFLLA